MPTRKTLFIDANQYLDLFRVSNGNALLAPLMQVKDYVFIPRLVVSEVERNKLSVTECFLREEFNKIAVRTIGVPDHLFGIDKTELDQLRGEVKTLSAGKDTLLSKLEGFASDTLRKISHSQDDVSLALTEIFKHALEYDEQQLQRARNRRELGNPPGKANDPLGDQISWEQLLSHVNGETVLWIISRDFDYVSISRGEVYLHPVLRRELSERGCSEVHVFSDLVAGLTHFIKSAQLPDESLPTGDTAKLLESELQSPRAMIARFWDDTLKAAQGALRKRGIRASAPFRAVSLALQQHGLISASLIPVFEELRRQRNEALHNPDFDPASEEIDFLERISSRLMNHFNSV